MPVWSPCREHCSTVGRLTENGSNRPSELTQAANGRMEPGAYRMATRAKQAMSDLVFGREIELRPHLVDRYGRKVAQVLVDGKDAGMEMLRQGFAWVYDPYITEASMEVQETYRKAQEEPRPNDWGCGVIQIPFRRGYFVEKGYRSANGTGE